MNDTIDSLVAAFDLSQMPGDGPEELSPVTFWLPVEYKAKYDLLQERSKRRFGKVLKEIIKRSMDRVDVL